MKRKTIFDTEELELVDPSALLDDSPAERQKPEGDVRMLNKRVARIAEVDAGIDRCQRS